MRRRAGSPCAARNHSAIVAMRMTTYPAISTALSMWCPASSEWKKSGRPRAMMMTPIISTNVATRKNTSSVS